jgi:hypothetical protein
MEEKVNGKKQYTILENLMENISMLSINHHVVLVQPRAKVHTLIVAALGRMIPNLLRT